MFLRHLSLSAAVSGVLLCSLAAGAQSVSASLQANRTSGAAPLAVFFDATGTSCGSGCDAFHDLHFAWDFDDPGSGRWGQSGKLRNEAFGPTTAHVFEQPGSYTVTLRASSASGQSQARQVTIQVADPNQVWSGSGTLCVSSSGNFQGCPSGAQRKTTSSLSGACGSGPHRCLFRRGETFSGGRLDVGGSGPGMVGAYGSGSSPELRATSGSVVQLKGGTSDWRVTDLKVRGYTNSDSNVVSSGSQARNVLVMNTSNVPGSFHAGASFPGNSLDLHGDDLHDGLFFVNNNWTDFGFGSGGNIMFLAARRFALLGNTLDDSIGGEHVVRVQHGRTGVISHNDLGRQSSRKAVLTIRSRDQNGSCSAGCGSKSGEIVISDNTFRTRDDFTLEFTAQNRSTETARGEDFIVERNFFTKASGGDDGPQMAVGAGSTTGITVRNNTLIMKDWQTYRGFDLGGSNITASHNSCFVPSSADVAVRCVRLKSQGDAFNNILYSPLEDGRVVDGPTGSAAGNIVAESNPFVGNPPTAAAHFALRSDSPGLNAGATVFNPVDFTTGSRSSAGRIDIGAFESGASSETGSYLAPPVLISVD